MSKSLTVLREQGQHRRFERLRRDDSRTALAPGAAAELAAELKRHIDGEVRFDKGTRALYATDGSNYRQAPIGVVIPRARAGCRNDRAARPRSTAPRSSPAAAAPAWPASAATSPW